MLTGSAPRDFPPRVDPWRVVLENPAVPIRRRNPEVPERLAKVVNHALTERPGIGFTTVAELRHALVWPGSESGRAVRSSSGPPLSSLRVV
jgi:eukaryotic-like serine/threonine-protein kinase